MSRIRSMGQFIILIGLVALAAPANAQSDLDAVKIAAAKWEPEIRKLEELDKKEKDPADAILFVGSSSVRLWETIAADMAPFPTIRRGYGGGKYADMAIYAERLIHPHSFRALVLFAANDVTGTKEDRKPEDVAASVRSVIKTVRAKHATTPIFVVEITPTQSRWGAWPKIRAVNTALAELCSDEPHVHWIGTAAHYLGDDDKPRAELFRDDKLHQNQAGYKIWSGQIKRRLDAVLGTR